MSCKLGLRRGARKKLHGCINVADAKYLNSLPTRGNEKNLAICKVKSMY